jgi:hypothetical protein
MPKEYYCSRSCQDALEAGTEACDVAVDDWDRVLLSRAAKLRHLKQ